MATRTMTINATLATASRQIDLLEAEILLANIIHANRTYLLGHPEHQLTWMQRWRFQRLTRRRQQGWPIAYLTGEHWFYGRSFTVNKHVLIPRPETELVVEMATREFKTQKHKNTETPIIVDVATGSGCVAVTLAAELGAQIIATDISKRALAMAKKNAIRHNVADQITFLHGSLLTPLTNHCLRPKTYDLKPIIVANLPYLPADHSLTQTPYEPRLALYGGGQDGLGLIQTLVEQCRDGACPVSTLILEIDPRQADAVQSLLAQKMPSGITTIHADLAGLTRVAVWKNVKII